MAESEDMNTIKHKETIFEGRKISLEIITIELPSGKTTTREVVRHPGAVVIIPRTSAGNYILLEQFRYALNTTILEFPAGTLEIGEAPSACAAREIQEETGFAAAKWTELGELYPAPGICDERQFVFLAEELSPGTGIADEDEVLKPVELSLEEINAAITSGRLRDSKSIAALYKAMLKEVI